MRPLLLLEMNEVPWRVIDKVLRDRRWPHVKRLFRGALTFSTISRDLLELSPWVTWPSLHRGLDASEHGILHIGQDTSTFRGTPIWQEYRNRGLSIGICGSLQSWPPVDPGRGGFYIPDTFARDARCIPDHIEPLQRMNLDLVRGNGLAVRGSLLSRPMLALVPAVLRARITPRTYARIMAQIAGERTDRNRIARRPTFQTILFWNVFKTLFNQDAPPAFSTFFTNHVASIMHRYWDHVFPEDFPDLPADRPRPHDQTMDFALDVMDEIVGNALRFQERCPDLVIAFASSMGQAAIRRRGHEGFNAAVIDAAALLTAFGVPRDAFTPLLAMAPQVAVDIKSAELRARVRRELLRARTRSNRPVFPDVSEVATTLSIDLAQPTLIDRLAGCFYRITDDEKRISISWENAGVAFFELEAGTGYHVAEGVLALAGSGIAPKDARTRMWAADVKALLMATAEIS